MKTKFLGAVFLCILGKAAAQDAVLIAEPMDNLVVPTLKLEAIGLAAKSSATHSWYSSWGSYTRDMETARTVGVRVSGAEIGDPTTVIQCIFFGRRQGEKHTRILTIGQETLAPGEGGVFEFTAEASTSRGRLVYIGSRWDHGERIIGWVVRAIQDGRTVAVAPRTTAAGQMVAGNAPEFAAMLKNLPRPDPTPPQLVTNADGGIWVASSAPPPAPLPTGEITPRDVEVFLESDVNLPAFREASKKGRLEHSAGLVNLGVQPAYRRAQEMLGRCKGAVERGYLRATMDLMVASHKKDVSAQNDALRKLPK